MGPDPRSGRGVECGLAGEADGAPVAGAGEEEREGAIVWRSFDRNFFSIVGS